jgi:hypothetical protein
MSHPLPPIHDAVFPRDIPSDGEERFLSIYGHGGGWKWAMHHGSLHSFAPTMFWFTPAPSQEDRELIEPCRALHQFLTPRTLEHIFGTTELHANMKKAAADQAKKRQVPAVTVYILTEPKSYQADVVTSADPSAATSHRLSSQSVYSMEEDVASLFKDVPVRLLRILPNHFFPTARQRGGSLQPIMTSDRLAALYTAKASHPSSRGILILHGGDVLTYSALDGQGNVVGGGISPGISMRFRALFDYAPEEDFPRIDWTNLRKKLNDHAREENRGQIKQSFIKLFAVDIEDGVVAGVISEVAVHVRNVVKQFLKLVSPVVGADTSVEPPRTPATVLLEGHDNEFLLDLLSENASDICPLEPGVEIPKKPDVEYGCRKNLSAYGIQQLLATSMKNRVGRDPDEDLRGQIIGLRGARFSTPDEETKPPNPRRGSFVSIMRGKTFEEDMFELLYDDNGEKDYVDVTGLYGAYRVDAESRTVSCFLFTHNFPFLRIFPIHRRYSGIPRGWRRRTSQFARMGQEKASCNRQCG